MTYEKGELKMITQDEKKELLEGLLSAHQSHSFYLETDEKSEQLKHSVFNLGMMSISNIAKKFNLDSKLKNTLDNNNKEIKEVNKRIKQLQEEIVSNSDFKYYEKGVEETFSKIKFEWQQNGFHGTSDESVTEYGEVDISFYLEPVRDIWDIIDFDDENEEIEKELNRLKEKFASHNFDTLIEDEYTFILDTDSNKEKIISLMQTKFPEFDIYQFKSIKNGNKFILLKAFATTRSTNPLGV